MSRKNDRTAVWLIIMASLGCLLLAALLAKPGNLILGEEKLFIMIYSIPDSFRMAFVAVTLLGSILMLAVVLAYLLIRARFDIALRVMAAGISSVTTVVIAKELVGRPRPGELIDVIQRELLVSGNGFPSGHTALATAVGLVLLAYLPRDRRFIVPLWILLVAVSRMYLGVHTPLDIVGGLAIGTLAAVSVLTVLPVSPGKLAKTNRKA